MYSRYRALCALAICLGFLPGCVPAGLGLVQAAISAGSTGLGVAGAIGQMNTQDRACLSMSPAERQRASVQDRVTCEEIWRREAQASQPNCARADQRIAEWRRRGPADPSALFQYNPADLPCPSVQQAFRDRGMTPPGGATLVSTPRR